MVKLKLQLESLENGDVVFGEIDNIHLDIKNQKIDVFYTNYLRSSTLGQDIEIKKAPKASAPFSHIDEKPFKDKFGNEIPVYTDLGEVVMEDYQEIETQPVLDEEGNVMQEEINGEMVDVTQEVAVTKQRIKLRLNDFTNNITPLLQMFKIPVSKSILCREGLSVTTQLVFLDE